jgi:hypothetical protein
MMRLGRRATLLVAFYLLASTATAYAECGWVLWEYTEEPTRGAKTYVPVAGKPTESECHALRRGAKRDSRGYFVNDLCLPDTVDPRGPKGSGR